MSVHLSYDEFAAQCCHLTGIFPDIFVWHSSTSTTHQHSDTGYLTTNKQYKKLINQSQQESQEESSIDEIVDHDSNSYVDDTVIGISYNHSCLMEYHLVYSSTYRVPLLLFQMTHLDGQAYDNQQQIDMMIWNLPFNRDMGTSLSLESVISPALTQQYHPILNIPFCCIHPCQTSSFMAAIQSNTSSPNRLDILSWLTAIGPYLGLNLPFTKQLQQEIRSRVDTERIAT